MPESANNFSLAELREAVRIIEHSITSDLKYRIQKANNGDILDVYEGPWDRVDFLPEGAVVQRGNRFLLNGGKLLFECKKVDVMWTGPNGIIVCRDGEILLNGKELLLKDNVLLKGGRGQTKDWRPHPCGALILHYRGSGQADFLLNDKESLYSGRYGNFWATKDGVIVENISRGQGVFLLNGKMLYKGCAPDCFSHPQGLVFQDFNGKTWLKTPEKKLLLFDKPWTQIFTHPRGIVVVDCQGRVSINQEKLPFVIRCKPDQIFTEHHAFPPIDIISDQPYGNPNGIYVVNDDKKTIKFLVWKT